MNYRSWIARSGILTLLAGVLVLSSGCDAGINGMIKTTITGAAIETVGNLLGNFNPDSQGD